VLTNSGYNFYVLTIDEHGTPSLLKQ
jgi:hypothetical protein